jgi:biopolymer transport protein ExbD
LGQKKDPHQTLENLERRSGRATLWILLGILVEIATILWFRHEFWEGLWSIIANAAIGFGLIVGYVVIGRAIIATRELDAESNEKVAAAEARASEANQKAQEAALELERLRKKLTPREITESQFDILVQKAALFPSTPFFVSADPGAEYAFVGRIIELLQRAGWKWMGYAVSPNSLPQGHGAIVPEEKLNGIDLRINQSRWVDFKAPAEALSQALTQTRGLSVRLAIEPEGSKHSCPADAIHVEIRRKL